MFVDEKNIMFEARIQMGFQFELNDDGEMMTVDVCVDSIESLEDLSNQRGKCLGKGDAWNIWEEMSLARL